MTDLPEDVPRVNVHLDGEEALAGLADRLDGELHLTSSTVHWCPEEGVTEHLEWESEPRREEPGGPEAERNLFGEYTEAWRNEWKQMPAFEQEDCRPWKSVTVVLSNPDHKSALADRLGGKIYHGKWCWFPPQEYQTWSDRVWVGGPGPRYPVYIPTKGRWETPYTIRTFQRMGVPFKAVVEEQEAHHYAPVVGGRENLLILPHRDEGLVATRNWIWDHARDRGVRRFWTFDDNIDGLYRLHENAKRLVLTGAVLRAIEDFVDRYRNVIIAGMQYEFFAMRREPHAPFQLNTRVYSNMLLDAQCEYRNEGFYNDDTDLCLRVLKDGHPTILFYAFLVNKIATMTVDGGMTTYYREDGRKKFAEELRDKHPDVVTVTKRWGRWHHLVDYSPFARNRLIRRDGVELEDTVNEYGMRLVKRGGPDADPATGLDESDGKQETDPEDVERAQTSLW